MAMLDKPCSEFIRDLGSKAPVPGGGGAAALGGAVGMALSNMVGNLTTGKKKYADVEDEVIVLIREGQGIIHDLTDLVDRDAEVFEPLSKAYGLPKATPEEARHKEETMEKCCKAACLVPLEIMERAYAGIRIHARMGEIGTMIAISDVGCGVALLKSALIAASLNVIINLNAIGDQEFVDDIQKKMNRLLSDGSEIADKTLNLVITKLTK